MTTTYSVTFGQDGDDLVVTNAPPAPDEPGLWLPEEWLGQIARVLTKTRAPQSAYLPAPLLAVYEDITDVSLTIYAQAPSSAGLQALREQVEAAASQWSYALTLLVNGVSTTYDAEISLPVWSPFDSGMDRAHIDRCSLVIPVNP